MSESVHEAASEATAIPSFWCFISYRHTDNRDPDRRWASWLHQQIERYKVPPLLVGETNERGDVIPERIYPVFRDETSLPADASLTKQIERALEASKYLIVLCSPRAVESNYVEEEIRWFQKAGRSKFILPAIIAGEPGDSERECFPEPLRHRTEESEQSELNAEPLAADFRLPNGLEGYTSAEAYRIELASDASLNKRQRDSLAEDYAAQLQLMKLKIIAGILGVSLEKLRDRDKAYQLELARAKARTLMLWLITVALLAVASVVAAGLAIYQRKVAVQSLNELAFATSTTTPDYKLNDWNGPNFVVNSILTEGAAEHLENNSKNTSLRITAQIKVGDAYRPDPGQHQNTVSWRVAECCQVLAESEAIGRVYLDEIKFEERPEVDHLAAALHSLKTIKSLRELNLSNTRGITESHFRILGEFRQLETLDIDSIGPIPESWFLHLKELRGLKQLQFEQFEFKPEPDGAFAEMLRSMKSISNVQIDDPSNIESLFRRIDFK